MGALFFIPHGGLLSAYIATLSKNARDIKAMDKPGLPTTG